MIVFCFSLYSVLQSWEKLHSALLGKKIILHCLWMAKFQGNIKNPALFFLFPTTSMILKVRLKQKVAFELLFSLKRKKEEAKVKEQTD